MERRRSIFVAVTASLLGAFILWPTAPTPADRKPPKTAQRQARPAATPGRDEASSFTDPPDPPKARSTGEPHACGDDPDVAAPATIGEKSRGRGTPAEWRASYKGISGYDKHDPPALLPLDGAGGLPPTTVALVREGALVLLQLPKGEERVYDVRGGRYAEPTWSADGRWLFFLADREDRPRFGDRAPRRITRMRPDGSERRVVSGPICEESPSWAVSPNGQHVAYVVPTFVGPDYQDTTSLRLVDITADEDRLLEEGIGLKAPTFSPDGRTLSFARTTQTDETIPAMAISSFDLVARARQTFLQEGLEVIADLAPRPDGRFLFVGDPEKSFCCRAPQLFLFDPRTRTRERFGTAGAPGGFLRLLPSASGSRFLAAYSVRGAGGGFADYHSDVRVLDAQGKPTTSTSLAEAFPRPFYAANSPSFLTDERHAVLQLTLRPWLEDTFREHTLVLADLERPGPLYRLTTGESPAVRPRGTD